MKIISLNAWYGELKEELSGFVKAHQEETEVFCFQEFSEKMDKFITPILKNYKKVAIHKYVNEHNDYYQATFVKEPWVTKSTQQLFLEDLRMGLALNTVIEKDNKLINLWSVHGIAYHPDNKLDTEGRLDQSRMLIENCKGKENSIIMGDFNSEPNIESVTIWEKAGFKNLIKEYKIETTRNHWSWDMYPESKQLFADYTFVSPEIKIKKFEVLKDEVSDHLPMFLEIED